MRSIVPLYTFAGDTATYTARTSLLNPGDIAVVTSGNSGPFPHDPALVAHVRQLEGRGVIVMGYVPVGYGARPLGDVFRDVTAWRRNYGVRCVFFDEWHASAVHEVGLAWNMVRGYAGPTAPDRPIVALNPGVPMPTLPSVPPGTLVVTHEGTACPPPRTPRPWEAAIVHSHPRPDGCRTTLERDGWGWGYTTSDGPDGNPFDELADN